VHPNIVRVYLRGSKTAFKQYDEELKELKLWREQKSQARRKSNVEKELQLSLLKEEVWLLEKKESKRLYVLTIQKEVGVGEYYH